MALRVRDLYYSVRIGNYASRPLRQLEADFHRLGASGDAAATRLERLQLQQAKLARGIALRQATIPAIRETQIMQLQERQAALQRTNIALADKRAAINQKIIAAEINQNRAIERGNFLTRERVILEGKQAAASLRARRTLLVQEATLASQVAQANRAQAMLPARRRLGQLEQFRAQAQRATVAPLLTGAQRRGALAGRIADDPSIARLQARYIAAEKAIQSADLAMKRLQASEQTLIERQQILARSTQRLAVAEKEVEIVTQQQRLALDRLDAKTVDNALAVDNYRREIQAFTAQLQVLLAEERRLSVSEQTLITQRLDAAASIARYNEELGLEVAELQRVNRAIVEQQALMSRQRWDKIALGGRAVADFGRTAQFAGGLTVLAFGLMGRAAAKFRTQVTLAATQVGNNFREVQQSTEQMGKGILAQMKLFPASAEQMTKASYDIYSSLTLQGDAQQQTAEGLQILTEFNKAAVAGQTDLKDVTNAGITILNQFGKTADGTAVSIEGLDKMLDQAFAAVRFGRETFQEFTTTLANAAPAAKAAHQSFADMAGTLAFLTRRLPVRQASVAYARLLEILQRSGQGLAKRGIQIRNQATGFMRPLDQIIGDIVEKFPKLAEGRRFVVNFFKEITKGSGTGTMGTIQARRAMVFLVQQFVQYQHVLQQTTHDQGEFWKSFRALQASPEVKWQIFTNQLHALAIEIGQYAIPALIKMLSPIQRAVKWFESLSDAQKKQIATLGVWIGGILLIGGSLAVFVGMLTRMVGTFANLGKAMAGSRIGMLAMGAETGALTIETGGLFLIAAALFYLFIKYPKQFRNVVGSIFDVKGAFHSLGKNIDDVRTIIKFLNDEIDRLRGALSRLDKSAHNSSAPMARLFRWTLRLYNQLEKIASIKPIKVSVTIAFKATGLGGKLGAMLDVIKNPLGAALGAVTPRPVRFGLGLLHESARVIDHFHKANEKIKSIPLGPPEFRTARGGPAIAQNLKQMQKEAAAATKTQAKAQVIHNKTVQDYINLAIKANRVARQRPHDLQAQIRTAQIMNQIQKRFTGAELEGIQAVISADNSATKKRISNAKQVADSVVQNLRQMYDQLKQANEAAFGDVTQGVRIQNAMQWGAVPTPTDILTDLRNQVNKFRRWRSELERLSKRGVPFALLQQLEQAGPQAEPLLRGILGLSRRQFVRYVSMFRQGQALIKTATVFDFNRQLTDWRSHGKRAAIAFMKGMQDEHSFINRQMRKLFMNWMRGGNARLPGSPQRTVRPARDRPAHPPRHLTIHEGDIHIQDHGEDLSTKHRKAKLMQKNRRANRLLWGNT